jgi:hypothetical protein
MAQRTKTRGTRVARKSVARSSTVKNRRSSSPPTRTRKTIIRKVIRQNPKKVAVKRKIRQSRPIHKRILLHPVSVMLILCVGVFVLGWTYRTVADSYSVVAEVLAPPLQVGATITSPVNGQTLSQTPIVVKGVCPVNSIVDVQINNAFSGSAACGSDGTFQVETDIYTGNNVIVAQDFNVTGQAGPTASNVTAALNPALAAQATSTETSNAPVPSPLALNSSSATPTTPVVTPTGKPLLLGSDFHYQTFTQASKFSWQFDLAGGTPPYNVNVLWGDGQTTLYHFTTDPAFTITHDYKKPGYYAIQIWARDAANTVHMLQVQAVITQPGTTLPFGPSSGIVTKTTPESGGNSFLQNSKNWLWIAWPSLIVVSLMVLSFWLGEHQEQRIMLGKKPHRPLRALHR